MTPETIQQNRETFLSICRERIRRDGLEALLDYLGSKTDFFTAPSSTSFHLNEEGGLCQHSLNVYYTVCSLYDTVVRPAIEAGTSAFSQPVKEESLAVAALFHDVCKANFYHLTQRWKKDDNGRWVGYPGYEIVDDFPFGHGEKSCHIVNHYLRLEKDELLAIRWHMGMFDMGDQGSSMRFSYRQAMEMSPLVSLLQTADLLAANCLEKTVGR